MTFLLDLRQEKKSETTGNRATWRRNQPVAVAATRYRQVEVPLRRLDTVLAVPVGKVPWGSLTDTTRNPRPEDLPVGGVLTIASAELFKARENRRYLYRLNFKETERSLICYAYYFRALVRTFSTDPAAWAGNTVYLEARRSRYSGVKTGVWGIFMRTKRLGSAVEPGGHQSSL